VTLAAQGAEVVADNSGKFTRMLHEDLAKREQAGAGLHLRID